MAPDEEGPIGDADTQTGDASGPEGAEPAEGARCPYCGSRDVVRFSRFGSEVSSQQYECRGCGAPFERIRFDGELPDTRRDED